MIPGMPANVKHCIIPSAPQPGHPSQSYCGAQIMQADRQHFINPTHALTSRGGEWRLCPDCAEALKGLIAQITYKRNTMSPTDRLPMDREPHPQGVPYKPTNPPPTLEEFGADGLPG